MANEPGFYEPALDLDDIELPPGAEVTTAGPVLGWRALSAISATKAATLLEDIPQSIAVIPKSLIEDQGNISLGEAITNVSGVVPTYSLRTPGYDFVSIRGFEAEQWLDGLGVFYNIGARDALANIERIEVLKGPNAILYGGGNGAPIGGAVNVISKLPTNRAGGEFGMTFGSENYARPYFDINQPVSADGTVLFRMTGEYSSADSFIEPLEPERYALNPTLTFTNKTDTTLTIQGRASHWAQQEYPGLPAVGTVAGDFNIDRELFINAPNAPESISEIRGITASLDHKYNDVIAVHAKARWSEAAFRQQAQLLLGADGFRANEPVIGPSTWVLTNAILDQGQEEFTIAANVEAKFAAGQTRNVVLLGADYSHITDAGYIAWDLLSAGPSFVDLSAPSLVVPYVRPDRSAVNTFGDSEKVFVNEGAFVQIQSSIADWLHLLAGLRLAHVGTDATNRLNGAQDAMSETKLLPRLGALLDITRSFSVYASYSQGLKGQPLLSHDGAPAPEFSEQREAGIKFNLGDLSGSAAVFEIQRSNVPVLDGFITVDTSEERSRGFETDVIWQPSPNWRVLASYAFIDATLFAPTTGGDAGNWLVGVPRHSGRLWVHHDLEPAWLEGWNIGAGLTAASEQAIEISNSYFSDAYVTFDARVGFDTAAFSASLVVKNLTDEEYFVPFDYFRGRVAPNEPLTVYGSLVYRY